MRLIDADRFLVQIEDQYMEHDLTRSDYLDIEDRILQQPTIDAVEVVRCEDCRHANECHKSVQYTHNEQSTITIGYTPIEWCSRGEHKGGDSE